MKALAGRRARRLAAVSAVLLAGAAGVSYATNTLAGRSLTTSVIQACSNPGNGMLRLVADNQTDCHPNETAVSWNVVGPPGPAGPQGPAGTNGTNGSDGTNGVSPTVKQLAAGDPNCAGGGASITDAAGNAAYVCNGTSGTDGTPFSGTFTSPNGQFSISVGDNGIDLVGPGGSLKLDAGGATLTSPFSLSLQSDGLLDASAGASLSLEGALMTLNGSGGCQPAARATDQVAVSGSVGTIVSGAPTVCIG